MPDVEKSYLFFETHYFRRWSSKTYTGTFLFKFEAEMTIEQIFGVVIAFALAVCLPLFAIGWIFGWFGDPPSWLLIVVVAGLYGVSQGLLGD